MCGVGGGGVGVQSLWGSGVALGSVKQNLITSTQLHITSLVSSVHSPAHPSSPHPLALSASSPNAGRLYSASINSSGSCSVTRLSAFRAAIPRASSTLLDTPPE